MAVLASIPAEEDLVRAENTADTIHGHIPMLEDMQIVVPELVLDEECHHGSDGSQESACVGNGVQRQVADDVGTFVILAHLIARR